jgi:hypothetical protein
VFEKCRRAVYNSPWLEIAWLEMLSPGVLLCLHRLSHLKNPGEQLITHSIMKHRWNGCNKGVDF